MSLGGILLSGLGLHERERQRERDADREEEERRRRRKHRSHRYTGDEEYRSSRARGRRRDEDREYLDRRRSYYDEPPSSRRDAEYPAPKQAVVAARGVRNPKDVVSPPTLASVEERSRRRSGRAVSMRRASSTSSEDTSKERDTPPTTPGDASRSWSLPKATIPTSNVRPPVQMRGGPQQRETESSTEDDYTRLTPGKRKLRTGEAADGARGTDFMVGVRSDIGSVSSGSDSESETELAAVRGMHLKIVTRPGAADKMMTGALPPGTEPHRTTGPPTSRPLISRSSSKQSDSFLSQLLRPSPHHAKKRTSASSGRKKPRTTPHGSSPTQPGSRESTTLPAALPSPLRRRATAPAVPTVLEAAPPLKQETIVECLTCCDEVPESQAAKLECDHIMCKPCLKRVFELSVTDPAHMPPKCCTKKNIPLRHVAPLFDNEFKVLWNKKFQEYTTKDRMYCPKKGCGAWITPEQQKVDKSVGRRYGVCGDCKTKVCKKCNAKWHGSKECRNDKETEQLLDTAKKEGWQRCYSCKAMVQLAEGCNHMKCRCTAEFCMICGSKWKTCDCPWFNTPPENAMGGIFFPPPGLFRPRVRMWADPEGGPAQPVLDRGFRRGLGGYAAEIAARRAQEQADEELARRLQMGDVGPDEEPFVQHHPVPGFGRNEFGVGTGAGGAGLGAAAVGIGLFAQIARLALDNYHENAADDEVFRRSVRLGRNNATFQAAGWTRPRRRATVNDRSRAPAPDPPRPFVDVTEDPDSQSDDREGSDVDEFESARRRREARRRRQSSIAGSMAPSAAAMAGLGREGRRGTDRVGGWLDHVGSGGGPNPFQYEV